MGVPRASIEGATFATTSAIGRRGSTRWVMALWSVPRLAEGGWPRATTDLTGPCRDLAADQQELDYDADRLFDRDLTW
jgi:hypothetical protein